MTNLMPYRTNRNNLRRADYNPFDDFFRPFFGSMEQYSNTGFSVDVKDEGDHYLLEADMPGLKRDQVNIDVDDGMLTIEAKLDESKEDKQDNYVYHERRTGNFRRSFSLNGIDEEKISAEYTDGVLKLTLPKMTEQPKTGHKIEIQ